MFHVACCKLHFLWNPVCKRRKSQGRMPDLAPEPAVFFWLQAKYVFVDSNSVEWFVLPTCLAWICFNSVDLSFTSLQHGFRCPFDFGFGVFLTHEVQLHTFTSFLAKGGRFESSLASQVSGGGIGAWVSQIMVLFAIAVRIDLLRIWYNYWFLIVISSLFTHALIIDHYRTILQIIF